MGEKSLRSQRPTTEGLEFVRDSLRLLSEKDSILDHGPFIALVLRVELQESSKRQPGDNDWMSSLQTTDQNHKPDPTKKNIPKPLTGIRKLIVTARVSNTYRIDDTGNPINFNQPDVHGWIPMPQQIGNPSEVDPTSNYYILQHHQFVSESETVLQHGIPSPGSWVLVDWIRKADNGPRMPIYKKPIKDNGTPIPTRKDQCGDNNLQTNGAPGQNRSQTNNPAGNKGAFIPPRRISGQRFYSFSKHIIPVSGGGRGFVQNKPAAKKRYYLEKKYRDNLNKLLSCIQIMQYYFEDLAQAGFLNQMFKKCRKWPAIRVKVGKLGPSSAAALRMKDGKIKGSQHNQGKAIDFKVWIYPLVDSSNQSHVAHVKNYVTAREKDFIKWKKKKKGDDFTLQKQFFETKAKGFSLPHWFSYAVVAALVLKGDKIPDGGYGTYKNGTANSRRKGRRYHDSINRMSEVPHDSCHWDYAKTRKWVWYAKGTKFAKTDLNKTMKSFIKYMRKKNWLQPEVFNVIDYLTTGSGKIIGDTLPSWEEVYKYWKDNNLLLTGPPPKSLNARQRKVISQGGLQPNAPTSSTPTSQSPPPPTPSPPASQPKNPKSTASFVPVPGQGPGSTGAQRRAFDAGNIGTPATGGGGSKPPAKPASPKKPTTTTPKKAAPQPNKPATPTTQGECAPQSNNNQSNNQNNSNNNSNVNKKKTDIGKPKNIPNAPKGTIEYVAQNFEWKENKYKNSLRATMFVIHETGKAKPAFHVAKENYEKSQKSKKDGYGWMHFYGGRAGEVIQQLKTNSPAFHANWASTNAIGYEVCNIGAVSKKSNPSFFKKSTLDSYGIKILGPDGNIGGKLGTGKINSLGLYPGKNYALPGEKQCLKVWETIKWLVGTNKPQKEINLKIVFPAVLNDSTKNIGVGLHSSKLGGSSKEKVFVWGRFNPLNAPLFKNGNYINSWKKNQPGDLDARLKWKVEHPFQHGIVAHQRWKDNDGCFIEYYCLGRALGMNSPDSYFAAIGALSLTSDKTATGATNVTFLPDYKKANYVKIGKEVWGNNGDINWKQWMSSIPKAAAKDRDKKYETGQGIYDKFI